MDNDKFKIDFMKWFYGKYKIVNIINEFIKIRCIYIEYQFSDIYKNLTKLEKRTYNRKYIFNLIMNDDVLKELYKKTLYKNSCTTYTHCLINTRRIYISD
jgi:hypothetical protein